MFRISDFGFRISWGLLFAIFLAAFSWADPLDELALDRWAKLSEVERYQLQIAERYYKQQNWKAALAEYEKFTA